MGTLESPALPVEKLVGPNDVLVGDRIEFDRELIFVHALMFDLQPRFEPQA